MNWSVITFFVMAACVTAIVADDFTENKIQTACEDCGFDSCCLLGMVRYAFPSCSLLGNVGDACRIPVSFQPYSEISYPNGIKIRAKNVYQQFCPCKPSLFCSPQTRTCQ